MIHINLRKVLTRAALITGLAFVASCGDDPVDPGPGPGDADGLQVYYLEFSAFGNGAVHRVSANGGSSTRLATTGVAPDGISVDEDGGKIYWSNMGSGLGTGGGTLQKANLNGSGVQTLVGTGQGTQTPKQIQIDEKARYVYWCDREGASLFRASMDRANDVQVMVSRNNTANKDGSDTVRFGQLVGLVLDHTRNKIYFTDRNTGRIHSMGMDIPAGKTASNRDDVQTLVNQRTISGHNPIDLALDEASGTLYWTDRNNGRVYRGPLNNLGAYETLVTGLDEPIGIDLDVANGHMYFSELGNPVTSSGGSVIRANLDGSRRSTIVSGPSITGLALGFF